MFVFKKIIRRRAKAGRTHKTIAVDINDWKTMKMTSEKLKRPMIDLMHDAITIFLGFLYGIDYDVASKAKRDLLLITGELTKTREILNIYKEKFGDVYISPEELTDKSH